jgi:hypothetical protein
MESSNLPRSRSPVAFNNRNENPQKVIKKKFDEFGREVRANRSPSPVDDKPPFRRQRSGSPSQLKTDNQISDDKSVTIPSFTGDSNNSSSISGVNGGLSSVGNQNNSSSIQTIDWEFEDFDACSVESWEKFAQVCKQQWGYVPFSNQDLLSLIATSIGGTGVPNLLGANMNSINNFNMNNGMVGGGGGMQNPGMMNFGINTPQFGQQSGFVPGFQSGFQNGRGGGMGWQN